MQKGHHLNSEFTGWTKIAKAGGHPIATFFRGIGAITGGPVAFANPTVLIGYRISGLIHFFASLLFL